MQAFKGLIIKEQKLMMNTFLSGIGLLILAVIGGFGLTRYFNEPNILAAVIFGVVFAHVFYLPLYVLMSLNIEAKTQTWLHNPNSGSLLFLAKLLSGLMSFCASMLISIGILSIVINQSQVMDFFQMFGGSLVFNLILMLAGITCLAVHLSIWVLFYWGLFHSLKNVPVIGKIRWLFLIAFWIVQMMVGNYFTQLGIYQSIIEFGTIEVQSKWFQFNTDQSSFAVGLSDTAQLSITSGIIYLGLSALVFFLASWLLEKKVEV
ncbi:hypothetical protein [Cytobacillus purgationiresistens]|uniref:Uncharacterized protein n=1 Tax=Cytobacillus purgationiresistens TaxID=863449 RepID=A0ABU0AE96_9BACI|nr:hypothetical protein [Cytobacillus purgationiresistens]MDQ0269574.1 hypothetical protein [Cytobacillus purgationiresistens]